METLPQIDQKWFYEPSPANQHNLRAQHAIIDKEGAVVVDMAAMSEEVARSIVHTHNLRLEQLFEAAEKANQPHQIAIIWQVEDVQSVREHITDEQAAEILDMVEAKHDANMGVNWEMLEFWADELYPKEDESESA